MHNHGAIEPLYNHGLDLYKAIHQYGLQVIQLGLQSSQSFSEYYKGIVRLPGHNVLVVPIDQKANFLCSALQRISSITMDTRAGCILDFEILEVKAVRL